MADGAEILWECECVGYVSLVDQWVDPKGEPIAIPCGFVSHADHRREDEVAEGTVTIEDIAEQHRHKDGSPVEIVYRQVKAKTREPV